MAPRLLQILRGLEGELEAGAMVVVEDRRVGVRMSTGIAGPPERLHWLLF